MNKVLGANKPGHKINWLKLVGLFVLFTLISLVIAYLGQKFLAKIHLPHHHVLLAYLVIFGITLVVNLSFLPIPFAISLLIVAAGIWNPILVALVGSLGASVGELSGYYFGLLGKKTAIPDETIWYQRVRGWIQKYGMWAIAFLSFQPIIPFEVGGIIAGATKMPIRKFFPALWLGKFPKYIILIYIGSHLVHLLPFSH